MSRVPVLLGVRVPGVRHLNIYNIFYKFSVSKKSNKFSFLFYYENYNILCSGSQDFHLETILLPFFFTPPFWPNTFYKPFPPVSHPRA